MSSKLYFQEDSIQLIEISSEKSSTENVNIVQSPSTLAKLKKKNKIDSPTVLSTNISSSSPSTSKISDIFIIKSNPEPSNKQLKPIPAPRKLKPVLKQSSKENSASTSIETQEILQENVRKSSETIDTISGSIFSQKSDTQSYKEKLRNRFLNVKRQAESSVTQTDKTKLKKKKNFKEAVEAILQNEESQINTEINKYEQRKTEWNTDSQSSYDFFCRVFENEEKINKNEEIGQASEEIESEENRKQSISEFLGINNLDTDLVEYVFPEVLDFSLNEKTVFKLNKNRPTKRNNELNLETRNFEDEGIYTSKINHISKYQLTILEDQLLCDENRDWFGSDGQLKILPDPRLENSFKPFKNTVTQSDFIHKYMPPTLYEPAENIINIYENTLELVIHEIKFKHHSLFSQEHVLEQKLIHLYDEYKKLTSENALIINIKKLEALRCAKNRLEEIIKQSGDCNETHLQRYKKYLAEIKNIREQIYSQGLKERTLKKSILFIWKSIKNLRKSQKYSSTSIKLIITKESVDYNNENKIWEQNLAQETAEALDELENSYASEINEYKARLKQWKQQHRQTNDDEEQSEISSENLGEKPKKPKKLFTEEQIKNDILERMNESLKPPGEPNLDFDLKFENEVTENIEYLKENLRKNDIKKSKIYIKILYNNREICRSKTVQLNNSFTCNFNEQFSIKLYKIPNNLTLEIYEQNKLLSKISLAIPELSSAIHDEERETHTEIFNNTEIVTYNHSGIGTGINLDEIINLIDLNIENSKLFCSGALRFNLEWAVDKNLENLLENTSKSFIESPVLIPTLFDIENLENWIKNYPDPLDPKNALFFDYIKNLEYKTSPEKNYFRINPDLKPFEFCSTEEIDNNPRFKLLKLRFNNEPEFKGIVVPNRVKEISKDIFSSYENRRKEQIVTPEILTEQFREENNIDTQRKWAKKYLEQAESRIIQLSKIAERKISLKDVLNEEIIPSFGSLGLSFMNWLQPKRPLRPTRKQIKSSTSQMSFKELNILVNIIGAIQVPSRKDSFQNEQTSSSSKPDYISVSVRPFVTVSFREECARTTVAEGPNPIWNQELNLTVRNKNDNFTVQSLQNIKDSIVIHLYDESIDDLTLDDRIRDTNIHQQLGCNWLGYFQVPFTTLLVNNRIEGTFKINLPPILLGYERQDIKTFQESGEPFNQKIDTFLTIFITLQPTVCNIDSNLKSQLETSELQYVEEFVTNWQQEYNLLHPQRQFSSFVTTLNGEKCCITRYFKEIKLPELNYEIEEELSELQIAKYVSLIPFRENGSSGLIPDIWLNPEQLLTLMMGSVNDHAVLLTCYFLTMELKAWFLLGYGLIDGYTSYVLVREKTVLSYDYFIYDVKTGKKYNVYDNNCTLQKVFCVVNHENVWANIQEDDRIHQTRFDFSKSSDWLQLFNKDITAPTNLQQINVTYYNPPSVLFLQERIEKKLRKKVMKWRKFSRTTFNHYSNAAFKKILAKLEEKNLQEINFSDSPEHFSEIQNLLSSYQIRGFATSFPYTNISDLIEFVQKTGVHLNDNPNIEFSLSVYAHSYNNNAVIIWLFIATLIRKR